MRTLRPNAAVFRGNGTKSVEQLADQLELNRATVYRVLAGESAPSARFVAQSVAVLPHRFEELFDVVDEAGK